MQYDLKKSGLKIGINYSGNVSIAECITVGADPELGIIDYWEDSKKRSHTQSRILEQMAGWYSKSPVISGYAHFLPDDKDIPSVQELIEQLPSSWRSLHANHSARKPPHDSNMRRHCRPFQETSWSPTGQQYYAIGNTFGYSVTNESDIPSEVKLLRILLCACGDLRNVLETVFKSNSKRKLEFVLNDGNVAMLARNAVLLHMIANRAPSEDILAVWSNHELTNSQHESMMRSITALADLPWPEWLTSSEVLTTSKHSSKSEEQFRMVLRTWATCKFQSGKALSKRSSFLAVSKMRKTAIDMTKDALGKHTFDKYKKEITNYIDQGSILSQNTDASLLKKFNVTLLLPELQYAVYFSSSIFRAVALTETVAANSAYARLLNTIIPKFNKMAEFIESGKIKFCLVAQDILQVLTDQRGDKFDFIDCSNIADYISLPAPVQAAGHRLKDSSYSRLRVESMVMYKKNKSDISTVSSFVEMMIGYSLSTFEGITNLDLVSPNKLPKEIGSHGVRIEFARRSKGERGREWQELLIDLMSPHSLEVYSCCPLVQKESPGMYCSPVTLVHLLSTYSNPDIAYLLIQTLIRCCQDTTLNFYRWEIETQTSFQIEEADSNAQKMKLHVKPNENMMIFRSHPLLIAFSYTPLNETSLNLPVPLGQIKQLFSTFSWDPDVCTSKFLILPRVLREAIKENLHVSILIMAESGLFLASNSKPICELTGDDAEDSLERWYTCSEKRKEDKDPHDLTSTLDNLALCSNCKKINKCSRCMRCRATFYCSKNCQIKDWKNHKKTCISVEK